MFDYARGLQMLKNALPSDATEEFIALESRMLDNLNKERLFGSTETRQAERAEIAWGLNRLALEYHTISYNDMCSAAQPSRGKPSTAFNPASQDVKNHITLPMQAKPPHITVKPHTRFMPTAYCYHLDVNNFPFVIVTIDNTDPNSDDVTVHITATILDYSNPAIQIVEVRKGEKGQVSLLPLLKRSAIATLNDIQPASLHTTVKQLAPAQRPLYDNTKRISLLARNTALLAVEKANGIEVEDLSESLAGWVTPRDPKIVQLLRRAAEHHPQRKLEGYPERSTPETASIVRRQVQAIFDVLKYETNLLYIDEHLTLGTQPDQYAQRIQLPTESLTSRSANCLDGCVLFASLLELLGLEPLLVIVPGHAFVGWRTSSGQEEHEFLETTLISTADFSTAQQHAQQQFDSAHRRRYFNREIFDPAGFARLIDIALCRQKEIYPLG